MTTPTDAEIDRGAEALEDLLTMLNVDPTERVEEGGLGRTTAQILARAVLNAQEPKP